MTSSFIKSTLDSRNEFRVESEFTLFNTKIVNSNLKIDTGCGFTTFPLRTLGTFTLAEIQKYKLNDVRNHVRYTLSYGVETGGRKHAIPITEQDKMKCSAMGFFKEIHDFSINGIEMGDRHIRINYDRTGNILLGMDILKDWDIHIGIIDTGETIFLGCPKEQINDEYLQELENTFRIASDINASIICKMKLI